MPLYSSNKCSWLIVFYKKKYYYHSTEPRLLVKGCGFGSRWTPWDCNSWKRFPSCLSSQIRIYFHIALTDQSHSFLFCFFLPLIVSQEQLDRAKEATKSAILMNLESRVHCSCSWSNPNYMTCFPEVLFKLHTYFSVSAVHSIWRYWKTGSDLWGKVWRVLLY